MTPRPQLGQNVQQAFSGVALWIACSAALPLDGSHTATSTSRPSASEWKSAARLAPTRQQGALAQQCEVRQLRDWVSVRCLAWPVAALTQLGGATDGVLFLLQPAAANGLPRGAELIFPVRAGQARVFQFWTLGPGYDGPLTVIAALVVQSDALEAAPQLLLHDALHEPVRTVQGERRSAEARATTALPASTKEY